MNTTTAKIQGENLLINGSLVVPRDERNRHYQDYKKWVDEGNTPEPEFTAAELDAQFVEEVRQARNAELGRLDRPLWLAGLSSADHAIVTGYYAELLDAPGNGVMPERPALSDGSW